MTIKILNEALNSELHNAKALMRMLLKSEPSLEDPNIRIEIIASAMIPRRQLDLVLIYQDRRGDGARFINKEGAQVDSFVLIIEVKHHSSDQIKFQGNRLLVRYRSKWNDASDQSENQKYELKNFQEASIFQDQKKYPLFINNSIWLPNVLRQQYQSNGGTVIHFSDLTWKSLIDSLQSRFMSGKNFIRTMPSINFEKKYHTFDTLVQLLIKEVVPTKLDKERIRRLNQTRFDLDKTQYIQNLGTGLLMLKGLGGTGKTFSLLQLALHLSVKGFRCVILTYNHGLISDISRTLRIIKKESIEHGILPEIMTRYSFIKSIYNNIFGYDSTSWDLESDESTRTEKLLGYKDSITSPWDFVLIDEGQDWREIHRDLIFKIFGPKNVIVAHGVDQFVSGHRCTWDPDEIPINRKHTLRLSRRTKGSTCITISHMAQKLGVKNWDLEPDPEVYGGRLTVFVESNGLKAMLKALQLVKDDCNSYKDLEAVDNLICIPDSISSKRINYKAAFDSCIKELGMNSWRGFDEDDRRVYPYENNQLRAVMYQSCRGMEGWTTACIGFDGFYDSQYKSFTTDKVKIEEDLIKKHGLLFEPEMVEQEVHRLKKDFANQWIMIPLTRSIDHLIIHLSNQDSYIGFHLKEIERQYPGCISWVT